MVTEDSQLTANEVDRLIKSLFGNKWIARFIVFVLAIDGLGNLIDAGSKIYNFGNESIARFEHQNLTDSSLVQQSQALAKQISIYVQNRNIDEPAFNFNNFDQSTNDEITYSSQTVAYYYATFEPQVATLRQEFLKRGMRNNDLDMYYQTPTNPLGIQSIANDLNDLVAQLQANILSATTTNQSD